MINTFLSSFSDVLSIIIVIYKKKNVHLILHEVRVSFSVEFNTNVQFFKMLSSSNEENCAIPKVTI